MGTERTGHNALTIQAFARNSTTAIPDPRGDLARAQNVTFNSFYPGGRYGSCSFFVPRDVRASWQLRGAHRVVIKNGLTVVWEGYISGFGYVAGAGATEGREVLCTGAWGEIFGRRALDKRWADSRTDNTEWRWLPDSLGAGNNQFLAYSGPDNRLKIIPKKEAWANGDYIYMLYTQPAGQTTKRIVCSLTLAEGGQQWEISLWRSTDNVTYTQMAGAETYAVGTTTVIVASSTVAIDVTLATPSRYVQIRFHSRAGQTPTDEIGTIYGEVTGLTVYSETGSINLTEIAKDVRGAISDINSDETKVTSGATYSLVPFLTYGPEMADSILLRAASFGDSSQNSYACYLVESDQAATPDGKPVLVVEQQPATTDYDYAIRLDDPNVVPQLKIIKDYGGVTNYFYAMYRDPLFDAALYREFIQTPTDDATLTDATSVTAYGQRDAITDAGNTTSAIAINLAKRQLALSKDPRFYVSGPVSVVGYVRSKAGQIVPAANILPGKRLRIQNYLTDEVAPSGAALTFIVTGVRYDDASETASLDCGVPDSLAVLLAQMAAESGA